MRSFRPGFESPRLPSPKNFRTKFRKLGKRKEQRNGKREFRRQLTVSHRRERGIASFISVLRYRRESRGLWPTLHF
jgi:hypothetical protein